MAEAKETNIPLTEIEKIAVVAALDLQQKSLERGARTMELNGRVAIATIMREELAAMTKIKGKILTTK